MAVMKRRSHKIPPQPMMKEVVEDEVASMKQGIVTILRTDIADKSPSPIRRTLSADMSSKRWLAQNGFFSSSQATVESKKETIKESKNPIWASILTDPKDGHYCNNKPHKRSSSTMSEKSLELCTESLGSETGSDSFSSFFQPYCEVFQERENSIRAREEDRHQFKNPNSHENLRVAKYRNAPVRPFPPPIRSITGDGDSLHVRSRREDGKLVLEAVSVPPKNYFHAQRGDGRLVLTLIRHRKAASENRSLEGNGEGGLEEEGDKKELVGPEVRSLLSPGKKNPTFTTSSEKVGIVERETDDRWIKITQSLPSPRVSMIIPQTPPCTAPPFNGAYEHFWRNKRTTMVIKRGGFVNPVINTGKSTTNGGKLESFVPFLKGCKEPKKSLLIWEPYYVATS